LGDLGATRHKLGPDGPSQLIVSESGGWEGDSQWCPCDRHLNCRIWVLEFSEGKANLLLELSAIEIPLVRTSLNHGYHDLVTATITEAMRSRFRVELTVWRFDGARYQRSLCASEEYLRIRGTGEFALDKPVVLKPHSCRQ
jgi:hypothetical protein